MHARWRTMAHDGARVQPVWVLCFEHFLLYLAHVTTLKMCLILITSVFVPYFNETQELYDMFSEHQILLRL